MAGQALNWFNHRKKEMQDISMSYFGCYGKKSEALPLLAPVVGKALHAHQTGNYAAYRAVITDNLAAMVSEEAFVQAYKEVSPLLGQMKSKKFLSSLRRGEDPVLLYKAKFTRTDDDILIQVTFKNHSQPPLIDRLWIE